MRFPSFSKDFRGSAKRKTLAFLGENPCFFQKSKGWRVRVPICSDLRSLFSGMFRYVPICSENKSEQIRETPFCRPLLQFPAYWTLKETQAATSTLKIPTTHTISALPFTTNLAGTILILSLKDGKGRSHRRRGFEKALQPEKRLKTQRAAKGWAPQAPQARGDEILRFQSQEP